MARKPQIFYDKTCPVCSNYIRVVKKYIPEEKLEYVASGSDAKDFKYVNSKGTSFSGEPAIDAMSEDFPEILNAVWVLPNSLKKTGLKVAYKVGSSARRTINKIKKGCNCGH